MIRLSRTATYTMNIHVDRQVDESLRRSADVQEFELPRSQKRVHRAQLALALVAVFAVAFLTLRSNNPLSVRIRRTTSMESATLSDHNVSGLISPFVKPKVT